MYRLNPGSAGPAPMGPLVYTAIANPAAGAEIFYNPPDNTLIQPLAVTFRLVTAAAAGTRLVRLSFQIQGHLFPFCHPQQLQDPNTTFDYFCYAGSGHYWFQVAFNNVQNSFPDWIQIDPNDLLVTQTDALDAADQFSQIHLCFRQYIIPS